MNEIVEVLKAISDPTRLRILMSLVNGELCVCRITTLLNLATSTISKHMSILKHAKLVDSRKEGKWIFYKLLEENTAIFPQKVLCLIKNDLSDDKTIKLDSVRLKKIIKLTHEELCKTKSFK